MVSVPVTRTFLGCIELRIACLVIAAIRLVLSIISLVILLFVFVLLEDEVVVESNMAGDDSKKSFGLIEFFIAVFIAIAATILASNLVASYWFIQGVTSNKPHKMKYYLWIEVAVIILLLLYYISSLLHVERLITALVEMYIYICSNSLYQECLLSEYNDNNATENTAIKLDAVPPPAPEYSTYDEKTQLQQTQLQQTQPQNSNPFKE